MAIFDLFKNKNKLYDQYFEKTGIRITDEPKGGIPTEIDQQLEKLYHLAQSRPQKAIPELEGLLDKYPNVPSIKNFLFAAYTKTGQDKKADKLLDLTIRQHPKYIFGIATKILNCFDHKEVEKYGPLLGTSRDIRSFNPEETAFHITEFISYQSAAAIYEALTGDDDGAVKRLDSLIELGVDKKQLKVLAGRIGMARIQNGLLSLQESSRERMVVESFPRVHFKPTDEPPQLEHPELKVFYKKSHKNISTAEIDQIMQLPRESIVRDLERILEDAIRRWEYFQQFDYDNNEHEFIIHALYFMGALRAEGSLQKVLDLLRMGEGFTEYWFAEASETILFPTLYFLGKNQLEALKVFVLEPNTYWADRLLAVKVAAQVALHHPERRAEVVNWFEDVFTFLLENENDKNLVDSEFIAFSVGKVLDFRGTELWPLIEKLYVKGWVPDMIQGNLEEMKKEISYSLDASEIIPLPQDIHEFYSEAYLKRKAEIPEWKRKEFNQIINKNQSAAEKMVQKEAVNVLMQGLSGKNPSLKPGNDDNDVEFSDDNDDYDYEPIKQVKREAPKVGRNDPCPCGSGKKYKKCCMNK